MIHSTASNADPAALPALQRLSEFVAAQRARVERVKDFETLERDLRAVVRPLSAVEITRRTRC